VCGQIFNHDVFGSLACAD